VQAADWLPKFRKEYAEDGSKWQKCMKEVGCGEWCPSPTASPYPKIVSKFLFGNGAF